VKLRPYHNVIPISEALGIGMGPAGWCSACTDPPRPPRPRSHPAAQALMAGLMQGIGEREGDPALIDAGRRLGEAAQKGQQAAPQARQRPRWLRAVLSGSARGRPRPLWRVRC
jgi:hypothetical protein